mmetsp:Transcript_26750/g.64844  ORF Transcript_26750/g.64844 Transcript_26750/m.64844 type:complete len:217 (-) Transcript_26750:641-1291(-)
MIQSGPSFETGGCAGALPHLVAAAEDGAGLAAAPFSHSVPCEDRAGDPDGAQAEGFGGPPCFDFDPFDSFESDSDSNPDPGPGFFDPDRDPASPASPAPGRFSQAEANPARFAPPTSLSSESPTCRMCSTPRRPPLSPPPGRAQTPASARTRRQHSRARSKGARRGFASPASPARTEKSKRPASRGMAHTSALPFVMAPTITPVARRERRVSSASS